MDDLHDSINILVYSIEEGVHDDLHRLKITNLSDDLEDTYPTLCQHMTIIVDYFVQGDNYLLLQLWEFALNQIQPRLKYQSLIVLACEFASECLRVSVEIG